jgi:hypothetical protein
MRENLDLAQRVLSDLREADAVDDTHRLAALERITDELTDELEQAAAAAGAPRRDDDQARPS